MGVLGFYTLLIRWFFVSRYKMFNWFLCTSNFFADPRNSFFFRCEAEIQLSYRRGPHTKCFSFAFAKLMRGHSIFGRATERVLKWNVFLFTSLQFTRVRSIMLIRGARLMRRRLQQIVMWRRSPFDEGRRQTWMSRFRRLEARFR